MNSIPDIEERALYKLIDRLGSNGDVFNKQLGMVRRISRECTGVGVYVNFELEDGAPVSREVVDAEVEGVFARSERCSEEIGFILFIRSGLVRSLEAYTYSDTYPSYVECDYSLYCEDG